MNRGDVVVVPFPFQDRPGEKIRPAVIVQSDAENRRLVNTILAMITGNLEDAGLIGHLIGCTDATGQSGAESGTSSSLQLKCSVGAASRAALQSGSARRTYPTDQL
jgi:hypothetical protein